MRFPLGGLDRRYAFQDQAPYTTPDCMNVWPLDVTTGRERGGVRPGLTSLTTVAAPYGWTTGNYLDSGSKEALFVTTSGGTYSTLNGSSWTLRVNTAVSTNLSSCAVYLGYVYQAQAGAKTRRKALPSGSESDLSNAGGGTAPENCGIVVAHLDSLWLMADSANPQVIYKCATGDPTNWNTAIATVSGAWTNTGSEGGQIGHAITAGLSHDSRTLLVGSARACYAIIGNPRNAGATQRISNRLGPLTHNAWCKGEGPDGGNNTYLMTVDGLCVIRQGSLTIETLSKNKIPDELQGIDPADGDNVAIGFDGRWQGIHIAVDPNSGSDINYFYHIPTDSYWPTSYDNTLQLLPTFTPAQTATTSSILPMTSSGGVYQFDSASTEDIDSYIDLGPIRLAGPTGEGYIASIFGVLADGSDDCNWKLRFGKSCEEAFLQTAAAHTFTGRKWSREAMNYSQNPRKGGYAAYLQIYDVANERWLIEEVCGEIGSRGMRRVG